MQGNMEYSKRSSYYRKAFVVRVGSFGMEGEVAEEEVVEEEIQGYL